MSRTRLGDLTKGKGPGDEWYTYEAPENLKFWIKKHPWTSDIFDKNKLTLAAVKVEAREQAGDSDTEKYTMKNPLRLDCGIDVEGQISTRVVKKAIFSFRADGVIELNQAMKELSEKAKHVIWDVKHLAVYNPGKGAEVQFNMINPDSTGTSLYAHIFFRDGHRRLFPDVSLHEQKELLNDFQERLAHCTAKSVKGLAHSCALKGKVKKKQIIRRKRKVKGKGK